MADYKTIHGIKVKSYTTDPDNIIEGQVWYDKTNKVLQFEIPNLTTAGAWRTGESINDGRSIMGAAGTGNSTGLIFGGSPTPTANTESYNGTNWTEVADLSTGRRQLTGAGTSSNGVAFGGRAAPAISAATEEWSSTTNTVKTLTD